MSEPTETYAAAAEVGAVRKRRTRLERIGLLLKSAPPSAWFGMIVVALYILVALLADVIAPYGEAQIHPVPFAPWGGEFIFSEQTRLAGTCSPG
jgi:peptide/nickel transport system permease protein